MTILQTRKGRSLILMVGGGIIAVFGLFVAGLLVSPPKNSANVLTESFLEETSRLVSNNALTTDAKEIVSTLGFRVSYDASVIKARAQTTDPASTANNIFGVEYDETEIGEPRDYNIAKFIVRTPGDTRSQLIDEVELLVSTNIREDYFTSREALPENAGKTKRQILIETIRTSQLRDTTNVVALPEVTKIISGIEYTYVRFERTNTTLGEVTSVYYDDFYFTVQNDRPYWASIRNIKPINSDQVAYLEAIIASVSYGDDATEPEIVQTSSGILELPKGTSYTPERVDTASLLPVVLKNQPAVVRIALSYCIDGSLRSSSGSAIGSFSSVCMAAVGSGSIISSDGYIATNGHVVRAAKIDAFSGAIPNAYFQEDYDTVSRVAQAVVDYYVAEGRISQSDATNFMQRVNDRSLDAIRTASDLSTTVPSSAIVASNERYTYAIQTSNDPFRIQDASSGDIAFVYNDTVLKATYVDSNYVISDSGGLTYDTVGSDVAILKMDGNFPIVELGSIDSVREETLLTALGYPAFVDGGLGTEQEQTVPAVTQGGLVETFFTGADTTHLLIRTTIPISGGNSGGPSFNEEGLQIGLNTYGEIECPDGNCFGNGIARDIEDLKKLIEKNNITLNTNSAISKTWNEGLDALERGDGAAAKRAFESVAESYPANYLAADLAVLSASVSGGSPFASFNPANGLTVQTVFLVIAGLIVLVVIVPGSVLLIMYVKKSKKQPVVAANGTPPVAPVAAPAAAVAPQAPSSPVQTVQTPPAPQQTTPFNPFAPQQPTPPQTPPAVFPTVPPVPPAQPPEPPQPDTQNQQQPPQ